jgi:mRNA-degrading endonuclease RelE of RelBE toxin-antitoxin system
MTYRIEIKRSARKSFLGLPKSIQMRMGAAINELAANPRPPGSRKLTGSSVL